MMQIKRLILRTYLSTAHLTPKKTASNEFFFVGTSRLAEEREF